MGRVPTAGVADPRRPTRVALLGMTGSLYNRPVPRPAPTARMTYAEYLVAEAASDVRHERIPSAGSPGNGVTSPR